MHRRQEPADPLVSIATERELLAAVLLGDDVASRFVHLVSPGELYDARHVAILTAAQRVSARMEPIESSSVRRELESCRRLEAAGGDEYLVEITEVIPALANVTHAAHRLRDLAVARRARDEHRRAIAAYDRSDLDEARGLEHRIAFELGAPVRDESISIADAAWELINSWNTPDASKHTCTLGVPELDDVYGGLDRPSLMTIAAAWGTGKSRLVITMALGQAGYGERPGIVSVEDPRRLWSARALGAVTDIPSGRIRRGKLSSAERQQCAAATQILHERGFRVVDVVGRGPREVANAMRHLVREHGCTVVYVDHLHAIDLGDEKDIRTGTTRALAVVKRTGAELGVPVILTAQLVKADKGEEWQEPTMRQIRETGAIAERSEHAALMWCDCAPPDNGRDDRDRFIRAGKVKGETTAGQLVTLHSAPGGLLIGDAGRDGDGRQQSMFDEPIPEAP